MSVDATAAAKPEAWTARPEGGSRFAMSVMLNLALIFGRAPARLLLYPITLYFYLRRGPERRASRAYLERVLDRPVRAWDVARHIHCFASTILDRAFLLGERFKRFDVNTHGLEQLHRAMDLGRGVLLLGSHLGNFDALRVLSLQRPDVQVRVLLDVRHNAAITALLLQLNPVLARGVIDAGQDGPAIVLAIKDALEENALVTLLADRPRPGEAALPAQFLGHAAAFPTAPWLIAAALKAPVVLCFGLYRGGNRYELHFEVLSECVEIARRDRNAALAVLIQRYADRLSHYARLAPYNWFNFYDFWQTQDAVARPDAPAVGGGAQRRA